jgi:hypothetical protein
MAGGSSHQRAVEKSAKVRAGEPPNTAVQQAVPAVPTSKFEWRDLLLFGLGFLVEALALLFGFSILMFVAAIILWFAARGYRHERSPNETRQLRWILDIGSAVSLILITSILTITIKTLWENHTKPHSTQTEESSVKLTAYIPTTMPYQDGYPFAGIVWKPQDVDVRLDLENGSVSIRNLDFRVRFDEDTSVAGVGQITQIPNVVAFLADNDIHSIILQGDSGAVPIKLGPGTGSIYRVQCPDIFANTVVQFTIAATGAIRAPADGSLPKQFTFKRKAPTFIRVEGSYEASASQAPKAFEYSHQF